MPLYVEVPINNPSLHDQAEPKDVDDETFQHAFDPKKPGTLVKVYRFVCFILFLGPIRIIATMLSLFIFYLVLCILPIFKRFHKDGKSFKLWAWKVSYPFVRLILLCVGVVHFKVNGELKDDTRTVVTNHLTGVDAASLFATVPCQFLATAGTKSNTFCYRGSLVFDQIYVDRTKSEGATKLIIDAQNDTTRLPVAVFSEGRVTNGSCVIGFRSGAFVADTPLQPIALRYRHWLMPESMATISWVEWDFLLYIYQVFSVPFYTLEANILEQQVYSGGGEQKTSLEERAKRCQLAIANSLGCPAYAKTNKGTIVGKSKEKKE